MKSFTWRGYFCEWHEDDFHPHSGAEINAHFSVYRGRDRTGVYIGIADDKNGCIGLIRKNAEAELKEAQREYGKVISP